MTITAAFITENGIHVPHAVVSDREALINRIEANERELRRLGAERLRLYTGAPAEHDALLLTAAEDAASGDAGVGPGPVRCLLLVSLRSARRCRSHHTLKHHSGWRVNQESGGVLRWISPASRTALVDTQARSPT